MKKISLLFVLVLFFAELFAQGRTWSVNNLWPEDWLVKKPIRESQVIYYPDKNEVILYNGLVKRTFRLRPNAVCIDYKNMITGQQLLRAISPEARLTINGKEYNVGGLHGQKEKAYLLPEWVDNFTNSENDFQYINYSIEEIKPFINFKQTMWAMNKQKPTGKHLIFWYQSARPELIHLVVKVHYEIYDGLPLIVKWISVENHSEKTIKLDKVVNEILATVEEESAVVGRPEQMKTQQGLYIETNYAFNNAMRYSISDQTTHWKTDSSYTSQVNYNYETPCILEVYPNKAPGIELKPEENFTSIRTYELLMDSYDRERRGLAIRKMYSTIAPWTTMNPIFMHLVSKNDEEVKNAIDQCAATGYEALILSFGSHLNMEDSSSANIQRWKKLADYAHRKGIMIGGYSLFSSSRISDEGDLISPKKGKPGGAFFGNAPCFGSKWGLAYRDKIKYFFTQTGFNLWENDGPYPGDVCASVVHTGHNGLDDSQWKQMEIQKELYKWLHETGSYNKAPDP